MCDLCMYITLNLEFEIKVNSDEFIVPLDIPIPTNLYFLFSISLSCDLKNEHTRPLLKRKWTVSLFEWDYSSKLHTILVDWIALDTWVGEYFIFNSFLLE